MRSLHLVSCHWLTSSLAVLSVLLFARVGDATIMLKASLQELSREAEAVVRGKVLSAEGRRSGDGLRIYTLVKLEVTETWKGDPEKIIEIHVPGGVFGDYGQLVHGAPKFTVGEDTVVFLQRLGPKAREKKAPQAIYRVLGMSQGKLSITQDLKKGAQATPDLSGLSVVDVPEQTPVPAITPPPMPLHELKAKVESSLR